MLKSIWISSLINSIYIESRIIDDLWRELSEEKIINAPINKCTVADYCKELKEKISNCKKKYSKILCELECCNIYEFISGFNPANAVSYGSDVCITSNFYNLLEGLYKDYFDDLSKRYLYVGTYKANHIDPDNIWKISTSS